MSLIAGATHVTETDYYAHTAGKENLVIFPFIFRWLRKQVVGDPTGIVVACEGPLIALMAVWLTGEGLGLVGRLEVGVPPERCRGLLYLKDAWIEYR